ncbi:MAG: hypothetical protein KJ732_07070 [Candidatus Margulisbacteria bacterium]|nr:hypothetical protein [Candidatus Margulisiibacteriota bacterium]
MKKIIAGLFIFVLVLGVASHAKLAIGVDTVADANSLSLSYDFTDQVVGKVGLNYASIAGASFTGYGVEVDYLLPVKWGAATPLIGVDFNNDGAVVATTILALKLGVEAEVANGVSLSTGITPYVNATAAGASVATTSTRGVWLGVYVDLN